MTFIISKSKFISLNNRFKGAVIFLLILFNFLKISKAIYLNSIQDISSSVLDSNSIEDCEFVNNTAAIAGAALYLYYPGNIMIKRCSFLFSQATDGSAIYYEEICTFIMENIFLI